MRYARYLRFEKYIAASDTGGILERWKYGRRLLEDGEATTPNGNLRNGVLERLLTNAKTRGFKITHTEINRRIRCAKAYPSEAQILSVTTEYEHWWDLVSAGFPPVEAPEGAEPYDPRDADEKWRDFRNEMDRRKSESADQGALFELPTHFSHDTYGPRTPISVLEQACDESERMTANFVKRDAERRAYVDELRAAAGGDTEMTWYEAEGRRIGLAGLGLKSWDDFDEIIRDVLSRDDPGYVADPEEGE